MSWIEIVVLIVSGVLVGFINTLAGGGSIISLSVLMFLGLPPNIANGTNRIAILMQTVTAVSSFKKQKVLETKKALTLAVPAAIGSIIGAFVAVDINAEIFEKAFAIIMLFMLVFILYKPQKYLYGRKELSDKKISFWQLILFFFIGIYGGFIHVGIGYFLLGGIVLGAGFDLVKANAIKVSIAFFITIVAFLVFVISGEVNFLYGIILGIGTIFGALIAARMAVKKGVNFVRWVIVVLILVFSAHFLGLIDIKAMLAPKSETQTEIGKTDAPEYVLVIHGGAGNISKENLGPEMEALYIEKLNEVLLLGDSILDIGGSSLDAVEACINLMEDSPLFNAGKGAVFTAAGENELDASIMDGSDWNAGAVAGVKTIKNPISAARKVMENSKHVLLAGHGADVFADSLGLEIVDPSYFFTEKSWKRLQQSKKLDKHGTVGCVALDREGNLAAGTSTGGMNNKMWGRVGDSPIIGAGTYADNQSCAVSATGHGEFFIRNVVAYDISALMKYKDMPLNDAAEFVINDKLKKQNASGGIIAVDKDGNISMAFNTSGMFRGFVRADGEIVVRLYSK
jgi:L-asparaginase / beta-aspartyl-peptidase